jgi:hypothetical protein
VFGRRFIAILTVLLIAASLVPMAEAQGGRGGNRGPIRFEWTAPDSVKSANHSVALNKDGMGEATFRVGYSGGGGGGGPTGMASFARACQPGTKFEVPLIIDTTATPLVAPHMVSITPPKAVFDISTGAPSVPPGSPATKWSEKHVVSVHYEVKNATVDMATLNITTGPAVITGGQCAPTGPTITAGQAKTWANFTFPPKPAAVKAVPAPAESPGVDFVSVALIGLVALAFVARRNKE